MKVNDIEVEWIENMTIDNLLRFVEEDKRIIQFKGNMIYIFLNDKILDPTEYNKIIVKKEDEVKMIPVVAGG